MVVEDYFDSVVIENTGSFKGYYYIIEGLISPLNNIMPENLRIKGLIDRLKELISKSSSLEVIFALNPSLEGESTMLFIEREIGKNSAVSYSRLAMGVPRGSDIDYIDTDTLSQAIESRKQFN
jgi:recombination protein RecR